MITKRIAYISLLIVSLSFVVEGQRNSIQGRVVGPSGQGVLDARVLLKNGNLSDVGQDITDSLGNYRFDSLPEGVYYIEVLPLGTGYDRQTLRVELFSLSRRPGGSGETYRFDFQLHPFRPVEKPMPKKLAEALAFVQEVPPAARQKYKDAQKFLEKEKKTEAYAALRESIEIFPDYYDALDLLGSEYVAAGHNNVAVALFRQAVDVNTKGWHAYYGLGSAYSNLNMSKESLPALKKAIELNPYYARGYLRLGAELAKKDDSLDEAVTIYEKAIKLEPVEASEPYAALAAIYAKQQKYKEAADALENYLKFATDVKNPEPFREKIREFRKKAAN
jgi:tetratricopeptide (TPR) repeat protein